MLTSKLNLQLSLNRSQWLKPTCCNYVREIHDLEFKLVKKQLLYKIALALYSVLKALALNQLLTLLQLMLSAI